MTEQDNVVQLHVIRTGRDKDTGGVVIEYREISVRYDEGGTNYRCLYTEEGIAQWSWAFSALIVPVHQFRQGYSRYYHRDRDTLFAKFLESRKESVQSAEAALRGAHEQLDEAMRYMLEFYGRPKAQPKEEEVDG